MLTQETAAKIWHCYREITVSKKLLADIAEVEAENKRNGTEEKYAAKLPDAFGRPRGLTLGVPSGEDGHRIFGLHSDLAVSVITTHVANQQAELVRLNEIAKLECNKTKD